MEWVAQYGLQVLVGLTITGLGFMARIIKRQKEKQCALEKGVQALLRNEIIQAYNHYTEKEFCPIYAQENITHLYDEYHNLGGNGTIKNLVEELRELPKFKKEV